MKIPFSNAATTRCIGRNGEYTCTAIEAQVLTYSHPARLLLGGYTSRDSIANGDLEIPVADVPALIQGLQDLLANYYHSQQLKALV
ncbi:MAG: hypothetical protein NVS3B25_30980 [Hymenobacter sp.]